MPSYRATDPKDIIQFPEGVRKRFTQDTNSFNEKHPLDPYVSIDDVCHESAKIMLKNIEMEYIEAKKGFAGRTASERLLEVFSESASKEGNIKEPILIFDNVPIDEEVPPAQSLGLDVNPASDAIKEKGYVSEWSLAAISTLMGVKLACSPSVQINRPIHQVIPHPDKRDEQSSQGDQTFSLHMDGVFYDDLSKAPDDVVLLTLRTGSKRTYNTYLSISDVVELLTDEERGYIEKPLFEFSPDAIVAHKFPNVIKAIKDSHRGVSRFRLNLSAMKVADFQSGRFSSDHEYKICKALVEKIKRIPVSNPELIGIIENVPGRLVWLNNVDGVLHGREADSQPTKPDGHIRWLQRVRTHRPAFKR
ncbi:MAG: hypothetical protein WCC12_16320 [Anaerolineales bacterium]